MESIQGAAAGLDEKVYRYEEKVKHDSPDHPQHRNIKSNVRLLEMDENREAIAERTILSSIRWIENDHEIQKVLAAAVWRWRRD